MCCDAGWSQSAVDCGHRRNLIVKSIDLALLMLGRGWGGGGGLPVWHICHRCYCHVSIQGMHNTNLSPNSNKSCYKRLLMSVIATLQYQGCHVSCPKHDYHTLMQIIILHFGEKRKMINLTLTMKNKISTPF